MPQGGLRMLMPHIPFSPLHNLKNKIYSATYQLSVEKKWKHIHFEHAVINRLKACLKQHLASACMLPMLSEEENEVVKRIRQQTLIHNRNNVTRTEAYRQVYLRTPELHWALLAHMVSRNGGWSMTDLRGQFLPRVLSEEQILDFFQFFERCNGLIFQDAFPQLLLFEESKKRRYSLFHLLPAFNVSRFMCAFWEEFWLHRDSALITVGQIINEQSYIEKRAIQHPKYAERVYNTLHFRLQSLLQMTQIVFPFFPLNAEDTATVGMHGSEPPAALPRLAGVVAESFPQLHERIGIGKTLYSILFGIPEVTAGVLKFVKETPHSGSREDYWKQLFTCKRPTSRLHGVPRLYSPRLADAWPDTVFRPPVHGDWFTNLTVLDYAVSLHVPAWFDMTERYRRSLKRLAVAAAASRQLHKTFGK